MENGLYMDVGAMEPLMPDDTSGKLEKLAEEMVRKSERLSGKLHPETRKAIASFLRPMNSYYSNLIEGHDTHPLDIDKALKKEYSEDKKKRNLQIEARVHIELQHAIREEIYTGNATESITSAEYIKSIHRRFYEKLPDEFRIVKTKEGNLLEVIPGDFRTSEVEIGRHIAPYSLELKSFMTRFEHFYSPEHLTNRTLTRRIIQIAASHHRLAWIHPFLDGNGRVVRLFSDAWLMHERLDADGLWSVSRGLARKGDEYRIRLANADMSRHGNYDGRGNLSNKMLIEFCEFFLRTAIDQIDFMYDMLDIDNMLKRIEAFVDLMVIRGQLRKEAGYILSEVFLKGKISKSQAMRSLHLSDKTLKLLTDTLIQMGWIEAVKEGIHIYYYVRYPLKYSPYLFPGLYPKDKEMQIL